MDQTWQQAIERARETSVSGGWCNVANQEYKESCCNEHAGLIALHVSTQKYRVQNTYTGIARDDIGESDVHQALADLHIADTHWGNVPYPMVAEIVYHLHAERPTQDLKWKDYPRVIDCLDYWVPIGEEQQLVVAYKELLEEYESVCITLELKTEESNGDSII